ncbi:MAG: peptidylprolyl isomerase [Vicinamibacterales bacterium]
MSLKSFHPWFPVAARHRRVAAGLAALAAVFLLAAAYPAAGEIVEQILVKVNGDIFTKTQLEERQVAALRGRTQQMTDQQLQRELRAVTPDILVSVIDEILLLQKGRDLGYKMTEDMFKRYLESIRKENKLESDEAFQAALKQEGMTLADLRKQIETNSIIQEVQRTQIFDRISVTETEARQYYDLRPGEFTSPATMTLREILIKVPADPKGVNVAADEAAKEKADALRADILSGKISFEKAVADFSEAASKANAGLVGPLNMDEVAPELGKLLRPLKQGDLTDVIRTQAGYQIIKMESKSEPKLLSFEEARDQIADRIFNERRRQEFQRYMTKLRASAIIEWKNLELKKLYEERLKTLSAASGA